MPERITLNTAHFSQPLEVNSPDAVHPVGASHLKEYLQILYGGPLPGDQQAHFLSDSLMESLAAYSADSRMTGEQVMLPNKFLPVWLKLFTPVVESTHSLGKYVDRAIGKAENGAGVNNELTFVTGLFDVSSFVISSELELDHPRYRQEGLMAQAEKITPIGNIVVKPPKKSSLELLAMSGLFKAEHSKKIFRLRQKGAAIIVAAEDNFGRLSALVNDEAVKEDE